MPQEKSAQVLMGFYLMIAAVFIFACSDIISKILVAKYAVAMIAFVRYFVHCLVMLIFVVPRQGRAIFKLQRTGLVWLRGFSLCLCTLFATLALRYMPVGEAIAITYLAPLVVMILAGPLLGEKVTLGLWLAAFCGFVGVILIAHPGSGLDTRGVIFAILNIFSTATYNLLSRKLAATESTLTLLLYTGFSGLIVFGALQPWFFDASALTLRDFALMISLGLIAVSGHFLFTKAFQLAPASLLSPVIYVHLVIGAILGWLVFDHVPRVDAIFGMLLIAVAGATVALKTHFSRKKAI